MHGAPFRFEAVGFSFLCALCAGCGLAADGGGRPSEGDLPQVGSGVAGTSGSSSVETAALDCESYRDLPAAGTTLAIRNDRSTPIYLKQFGGCDEIELSFIDVEDGAGAHVDTRGSGVCEWPSCSEAQDLGDVGRVGYCAPCSGEPLLRLEPGAQSEALISINRFVVYGVAPAEAMPEACVAGADPSSLSGLACRAQVPVPAGDYVVKAQAFLDVRCRSGEPTCDCTPENGQCIAADVEGVGEISVAATMIALPTPWLSIAFP